MRAILWITLLAAALWAGWWVFGSQIARRNVEAAFAAAPAAGWQAKHAGLSVVGFPNRFDLTLTEPAFFRDGWGWRGPFLQVFALAYKPNHLIAAFPETQTLTLGGLDLALTTEKMQASLVFGTAGLDRSALEARAVTFAGLRIDSLKVGLKADPVDPRRLRLGVEALDLTVPAPLRPDGLPGTAKRLYLDAIATLSAPLDRSAPAAAPRIETLEIGPAFLAWGPLVIDVSGALRPDAAGRAAGRLRLTLSDAALGRAVLARAGLPLETDGPFDLTLSDGRIRLDGRDLGPAPRLVP